MLMLNIVAGLLSHNKTSDGHGNN